MQLCFTKNVIFLAVLCAAAVCNTDQVSEIGQIESAKKADKHIMVVFIHGTIVPLPNFGACTKLVRQAFSSGQQSKKSWYQSYLDMLKSKSIYRYQPSGADGFHPIADQQSACIAQAMFKQFLTESAHCYTFVWNGQLKNKKRIKASHDLYQALVPEIERLKKMYKNLEVMVVCHSHGGNVALNLAHAEKEYKQNLSIDKLVLLATPVQSETSGYAAEGCFKKVYNFYSHGDLVQKLDVISTSKHKSARIFPGSSNLTQIELKCGSMQPRHNELWLFGGKNNWLYRGSLNICPFPFFVFVPFVLQTLDEHYPTTPLVKLNVNKVPGEMHFSFSDKVSECVRSIDEIVLKQYKDMIDAY